MNGTESYSAMFFVILLGGPRCCPLICSMHDETRGNKLKNKISGLKS